MVTSPDALTGVAGTTDKHDVEVEVFLRAGEVGADRRENAVTLRITSPVQLLFGEYQIAAVQTVLDEEGVRDGEVRVTDNHALDFVIRARVRAAVRAAREAVT